MSYWTPEYLAQQMWLNNVLCWTVVSVLGVSMLMGILTFIKWYKKGD